MSVTNYQTTPQHLTMVKASTTPWQKSEISHYNLVVGKVSYTVP